jgi:hypothetical protein
VVGCSGVVLGTAEVGLRRPCGFKGFCGEARNGLCSVQQRAAIMLGVKFAGFISVVEGLQRMPVRYQCLMRRMGVVFPDLIVPRSLIVISRRLVVVNCSRCMMCCCSLLCGHDFSD